MIDALDIWDDPNEGVEDEESHYGKEICLTILQREFRLNSDYSTLSHERVIELFKVYEKGGEAAEEARLALMKANLRLVSSIVLKHLHYGLDFMDLFQRGVVGLDKAIERFEYSRDLRFSTYAKWTVESEIKRFIRENRSAIQVPNYRIEDIHKVKEAQRKIGHLEMCEASVRKAAEDAGMDPDKAEHFMRMYQLPMSFDEVLRCGDEECFLLDYLENNDLLFKVEGIGSSPVVDDRDLPDRIFERNEDEKALAIAMESLDGRQDLIIRRFYGYGVEDEESMAAIAREIGFTRSAVANWRRAAVKILRGKIYSSDAPAISEDYRKYCEFLDGFRGYIENLCIGMEYLIPTAYETVSDKFFEIGKDDPLLVAKTYLSLTRWVLSEKARMIA